ncbi:DNA helicase-2/ATP-dependent DNA helicase PcrA [Salirhabdus euzebyi]|uniref:DNA 3'-5' helicase n=1 Tax=Salirhabdus euzebyi TaxID=394506 RepID=A0A841Q2V3_9BACI|nr:UvrD-helicase domain-containing protein [Salirhabdus euzebyi]MBB6451608.1 DNA helicase-2/ATP-dependent DNA helicase PcrA [Salirhabdus euzebyi]
MEKKEFQSEQKKLDETIKHIENNTYLVGEYINKKTKQIQENINLVGDEVALRSGKKELSSLNKAKKEPYFGRIDINTNDFGKETFYIGKQGIKNRDDDIIVVDWRKPLASLYYNFAAGLSRQSYSVKDEQSKKVYEYEANVLRKREYTIDDYKIKKINQMVADEQSNENKAFSDKGEEINVTDDFLKALIEKNETTGYLKEIIATIQKEQNIAIRKPINQNLIIQGVAGSGKSSIALHRISYLLFNNQKLEPGDFLILGPSKMFISSFKALLPDLNLMGINQSTFQDFAMQYLGKYIGGKPFDSYHEFFENTVFNKSNSMEEKIIEFKGSEQFANVIDIFLREYKLNYPNRIRQLRISEESVTADELLKIYGGYAYLPFAQRIEKFINHVEKIFLDYLKTRQKEIEEQFEFVTGTFIKNGGLSTEENKKLIEQIERISDYKKRKISNEIMNGIKDWKKRMEIPNLVSLYKQILTPEILSSFEQEVGKDIVISFKNYFNETLNSFDLPPLLYLYFSYYDDPIRFQHLVIDEAQDFSFMHFAVLKKLVRTMTILGDKDQAIFKNYGQVNWEQVKKLIFKTKEDIILEMATSYRSTKEIINTANKVLLNHFPNHNTINPLNRSGPELGIEEVRNGDELLQNINVLISEWRNKYKRIAIIHKDEARAKKLSEYLKLRYKNDIVYVKPDSVMEEGFVSVLASYNSKGMEFDAVILVNVNEESFPKDDLHARLLYVLLTRSQQEVKIFYQDRPSPLLKGVVKERSVFVSDFDDIL